MSGNSSELAVKGQQDSTQERQRRRRSILVWLLGLVALLLLLLRCEPVNRTMLGGDGGGPAELDDSRYGIRGDALQEMSPGMILRIDLTMINPHEAAITVSGLAIAVESIAAPRADRLHPCSVADFRVQQPDAELRATIPAETEDSLSGLGVEEGRWPRITMVNRTVNQDGCKDAQLTLSYSGSATWEE